MTFHETRLRSRVQGHAQGTEISLVAGPSLPLQGHGATKPGERPGHVAPGEGRGDWRNLLTTPRKTRPAQGPPGCRPAATAGTSPAGLLRLPAEHSCLGTWGRGTKLGIQGAGGGGALSRSGSASSVPVSDSLQVFSPRPGTQPKTSPGDKTVCLKLRSRKLEPEPRGTQRAGPPGAGAGTVKGTRASRGTGPGAAPSLLWG